jgi:predicted transcriptional regulator
MVNWKKYGYVIASNYRKKIVLLLVGGPKTPKQIAKKLKLHLSHVGNVLKNLSENGIAICLTPDLRKGRIYGLTREGEEIANKLKELV